MGDAVTLEDLLAAPPGTHAHSRHGVFVRHEDGWWWREGSRASMNGAGLLNLGVERLAEDG